MKQKADQGKRNLWVLVGIIVIAAFLRLYKLGQESLWFDEGWSALIARMDWASLRNVLLHQSFPVYYAPLNLWVRLGDNEFALRLLSAIAGIVSIPLLYKTAEACSSQASAKFAALLLAISPLHIWYSQEARMYALATCFGLGATWAFLRAVRKGRWIAWGAYVLLSALAFHTFYYAAFILLFQGLFVFYLVLRGRPGGEEAIAPVVTRELLVKWGLTQVGVLLLLLPGLRVLLAQSHEGMWEWVAGKYGRPTLGALAQTAASFSLGDTWPGPNALRWGTLGLFAILFLAGIGKFGVTRDRLSFTIRLDETILFLLSYLCIPIAAVFLVSQFRPSYLTRYLVLFLPPYCAILGRGAAFLRPRALAWVLLGLILLATGVSLHRLYAAEQKEDWRGIAQLIEENGTERDVICLIDEDASAVFGYYYRGPLPVIGISGSLRDETKIGAIAGDLASRYERIWLVMSHTNNEAFRRRLESETKLEPSGTWTAIGIQLALFRVLG